MENRFIGSSVNFLTLFCKTSFIVWLKTKVETLLKIKEW